MKKNIQPHLPGQMLKGEEEDSAPASETDAGG